MKTHSQERDHDEPVLRRMKRAYKHPLTKGKFMERIARAQNPRNMLCVARKDGMIMYYQEDLKSFGKATALFNLRHHYENTGLTLEQSVAEMARRGFEYKSGKWEKNGNGHANGEVKSSTFIKARGLSAHD